MGGAACMVNAIRECAWSVDRSKAHHIKRSSLRRTYPESNDSVFVIRRDSICVGFCRRSVERCNVDAVSGPMRTAVWQSEHSVPVATAAIRQCTRAGSTSSTLQAARYQARRRGAQVSAHVAEPSASSRQLLEALLVHDSRDAPWLCSSLWHHSAAEQALTQLSVKLDDPPESVKERDERRKRQEYYANVGDAIRTLREEIPLVFVQDFTCESLSAWLTLR